MRLTLPFLLLCATTARAGITVVTDIAPIQSLTAQVMEGGRYAERFGQWRRVAP